jgi:hypothetical protein
MSSNNCPNCFISIGLLVAVLLLFQPMHAQQDSTDVDLLSLLGDEEPTTNYTMASFKTTRVINMHSIENVAGGVLDFRIAHRFGAINTGAYDLFGLDVASMRLGLEYGINDRLMVGLGRSNVNKEADAFVKYKILRQSTGKRNMPITMSWFSSAVVRMTKWEHPSRKNHFSSRLYYCHQLLIARKFNESLTVQIAPTVVHRNLVSDSTLKNDVFAGGIGARYKLTRRTSFNVEYVYVLPGQIEDVYTNSLSVGVDIETGGHVFQLHITNSKPMNEKGFITETTGKWDKGDIMFGFNVSRVFTVGKRSRD